MIARTRERMKVRVLMMKCRKNPVENRIVATRAEVAIRG